MYLNIIIFAKGWVIVQTCLAPESIWVQFQALQKVKYSKFEDEKNFR